MAGHASLGRTLTLKKAGDETEDFVFKNLFSLGEQSTEGSEIETTTHDSDGYREFVQGLKDAGSIEFAGNNLYDGQAEKVESLFDAGSTRKWAIGFNSGATLTFDAFVFARTFGEGETEGKDEFRFTLRLSGKPVYDEPEVTED